MKNLQTSLQFDLTGTTVEYFKRKALVLQESSTHVLIQFENGTKIATAKSLFEKMEK